MEVSYRRFCHPCPLVVPKLDTADADYAFAACALSSSVRTAEKREASWLFQVSLILFSTVFFFLSPPKWDPSRTPTWPETHRVQSSRVSSHIGASESFWVRWTGGSGKEWVREGAGLFRRRCRVCIVPWCRNYLACSREMVIMNELFHCERMSSAFSSVHLSSTPKQST